MKLHEPPNNTRPTTLGTSRQVSKTKLSKTTRLPRRSSLNIFARLFLLAQTAVSANQCPLTTITCNKFITFDLKTSKAKKCKFLTHKEYGIWNIAISSFKDDQCNLDLDLNNSTNKEIIDNFFGNNLTSCVNNTNCRSFYDHCTTQNTNNIDHCDISFLNMTSAPSVQPSVSPTTKRPSPRPSSRPTTAHPTSAYPSYRPTTYGPSLLPTPYPPTPVPTDTPTSAPSPFPTYSFAPTSLPFPAPTPISSYSLTSPPSNKALTKEKPTPSRAISGGVLGVVVIGAAIGGLKLGIIIQKMYQNNNFVPRFLRRDQDVESATEDVESLSDSSIDHFSE